MTGRSFSTLIVLGLAAVSSTTASAQSVYLCNEDGVPLDTLGDDKSQSDLLSQQGLVCAEAGKFRRAIVLFSEAIKHDPANGTTYLNRGTAQTKIGEIELALVDYDVAISLQPDRAEMWYDRATLLLRAGALARALADFSQAISLKPDLADAFCNRGLVNYRLGHIIEALADFTKGNPNRG